VNTPSCNIINQQQLQWASSWCWSTVHITLRGYRTQSYMYYVTLCITLGSSGLHWRTL